MVTSDGQSTRRLVMDPLMCAESSTISIVASGMGSGDIGRLMFLGKTQLRHTVRRYAGKNRGILAKGSILARGHIRNLRFPVSLPTPHSKGRLRGCISQAMCTHAISTRSLR